MTEYTSGDAYCYPKMKEDLQKYFDDELIFTELNGKSNVATFMRIALSILHSSYSKQICDEENQKRTIVETAAELIKRDIQTLARDREVYPREDDSASLSANFDIVPDSFLTTIFSGNDVDLKVSSISQAIIQAACPRPLQIGLAVQMHNCFSSKFMVDMLYSLSFGSSYREVLTFEMNAPVTIRDGHFTQFMADNVDHSTATLDGLDTFHGMGVIATTTPGVRNMMSVRRRTDLKMEEIVEKAKIDIKFYREECCGLLNLKFESLQPSLVEDLTSEVGLLWKSCWLLHPMRPPWYGVMQTVHHESFPGQISIIFMPMIDMNPSDKTSSTPLYIMSVLQQNALIIITSKPRGSDLHSIVLRLGAFHLEMGFLACIGHLMEETGLHDVLSTVYAPIAVNHMLQGNGYTTCCSKARLLRAVRRHVLVDAALCALLMSDSFPVLLPQDECRLESDEHEETSSKPLAPTILQARNRPEEKADELK